VLLVSAKPTLEFEMRVASIVCLGTIIMFRFHL
jgi:hypothetical protein